MEEPQFGYLSPENIGLFTDRYELTMMRGYREMDHTPDATFSLFFRELPPHRGYVIGAGLEQTVAYLRDLTFDERALAHHRDEGFPDEFLTFLESFEFTGDVRAVPEGTADFPNEPPVEVTAPIDQTQLFETLLINQIGFQSLIATKAARMCDVVRRQGDDQTLVDFGSRRAHGTDAGLKAARGAYVGGVDEFFLRDFFADNGVADGFGPGTSLTTSKDAPTLDPVYKLVAVEEAGKTQPSMKLSTGRN